MPVLVLNFSRSALTSASFAVFPARIFGMASFSRRFTCASATASDCGSAVSRFGCAFAGGVERGFWAKLMAAKPITIAKRDMTAKHETLVFTIQNLSLIHRPATWYWLVIRAV